MSVLGDREAARRVGKEWPIRVTLVILNTLGDI
jgi:hypothetical protein